MKSGSERLFYVISVKIAGIAGSDCISLFDLFPEGKWMVFKPNVIFYCHSLSYNGLFDDDFSLRKTISRLKLKDLC